MTPAATAGLRQSSDERREQVLEAAIREFAENGYAAAATAAIARRAGISQPYIYALFPSKREVFLAVCERTTGRIQHAFEAAAEGATTPEEALERMGLAYTQLIEDRCDLPSQPQSYAA